MSKCLGLTNTETVQAMHHYSELVYPNRKDTNHVCTKTITKQLSDRQRSEAMTNRSKNTNTLTLPGGGWCPDEQEQPCLP